MDISSRLSPAIDALLDPGCIFQVGVVVVVVVVVVGDDGNRGDGSGGVVVAVTNFPSRKKKSSLKWILIRKMDVKLFGILLSVLFSFSQIFLFGQEIKNSVIRFYLI